MRQKPQLFRGQSIILGKLSGENTPYGIAEWARMRRAQLAQRLALRTGADESFIAGLLRERTNAVLGGRWLL